jgi:hypothetical protein
MRQVLRLIGNRYGAALVLLFLIAVVVGFGKLVGHARTGSDSGPVAPAPVVVTATTASPEPDDGNVDIEPTGSPIAPSISPGAAPAQTVAVNFTKAWLHHTGVSSTQWFQGLSKYATKSLQEKLNGVDPAGVPAEKMAGDPTIVDQESSYVDISIPLDAGTITLRLIAANGRWLVDGVDWQRP